METIGLRVKKLIESKGVTAYEVAVKTGISESTLSRIISKDSKPNLRNSEILEEYFNISKQYLLTGEGVKEVNKTETPPSKNESDVTMSARLAKMLEDAYEEIRSLRKKLDDSRNN
jgi:transcriptional regulator with XRE-family HTH domain